MLRSEDSAGDWRISRWVSLRATFRSESRSVRIDATRATIDSVPRTVTVGGSRIGSPTITYPGAAVASMLGSTPTSFVTRRSKRSSTEDGRTSVARTLKALSYATMSGLRGSCISADVTLSTTMRMRGTSSKSRDTSRRRPWKIVVASTGSRIGTQVLSVTSNSSRVRI
jgi:hypothetical protein